jgi:hypothetical protein
MSRGPVGFWIITTVGVDGHRIIGHFDGAVVSGHVEVLKTFYLAAVDLDSLA